MAVCVCACVWPTAAIFPHQLVFPGLAMNKLCELFGQAEAETQACEKGVEEGAEGAAHNKCKKSRATPAAQNKVTSTTTRTTRTRTSPKIDSIMCVSLLTPPLAGNAPAQNGYGSSTCPKTTINRP